MGDYGKLSDFNPKANYSLVRFGGNTPITEKELNETQLLLSNRIKEVTQSVIGDRFLEGGILSLDSGQNTFTIKDQALINEGRRLYITSLTETLNDDETVYLDIFEKDITKEDEVKEYGNQQTATTVDNTLLDPRLEGIETARRKQVCFNLVKEVTRVESTSVSPVVAIGDETQKSKMGVNSKILQLEGNSYQNPETLKVDFVGTPIDNGYALDILTAKNNIFNINTTYEGSTYEVEANTLTVVPKINNEWNGLTCRINVKPNTNYKFTCNTVGKTMIHILDMNKSILAMGNNTSFNTGENSYIFITFFCNGDETLKEKNVATFSNISLYEEVPFNSNANMEEQSMVRLILPEPLAKVGDNKDVLFQNASNEWNILKKTKTVSFDGTENINGKGWQLALEGETTNCFKLEKAGESASSNANTENNLNNYAPTNSYNEIWTNETIGCALNSSGDLVIRLSKELAPSLQVFKNLLKTTPLEVTYPISEAEILTDVSISKERLTNTLSMDGEENEEVKTYEYTGSENVITITENKNGYTNDIFIEGNTVYELPLLLKENDYFKYDAETGVITNINKVDYRSGEEVSPIFYMDANTDYTLTFKAETDVLCELPFIEEFPTLKAGETYTKRFNSKDKNKLQIKIWSPNNEEARISGLSLYLGKIFDIPVDKPRSFSVQSEGSLTLTSQGQNEGEVDVQPLQYIYRGVVTPINTLRSLPNGTKDYIYMGSDEVYYYCKATDEMTLTGRERMELVNTLDNGYLVVELTKTLANVKPTEEGNMYCNTMKVKSNIDAESIEGMYVTDANHIRMVIDPSTLETADLGGVAKMIKSTTPTITYELAKEVFYECPMFDVKVFKGTTTVTLSGDLTTTFNCSTRENTGVGLFTFNDATSLAFDGVAPSSVTYVANYQSKLLQEEGHVYVPIATRVRGELIDLRIFDPNKVDFINESKDPTNGVYTVVKAVRQNGTLSYTSTLSDKDERGNYTVMTVAYYDATGKTSYRKEKYQINYDVDGDIVSKELMKQW